jgi:hypothetical protein
MYKVKCIADGMIVWKGNTVIGIKGLTLPEMFDDCDCVKLPGNAFDYCLATTNKYTEEQLAFINKAEAEWADGEDEEIDHEPEYGIKYGEDEDVPLTDLLSQSIPDDDLPF